MRLTKQQFIDLFKPEEMAAILAAAKVNVHVEAWLFRFNNLTPDADGTSVDLKDQRTIVGLQNMEAGGLLNPGRAAEIVATPAASGTLTEHAGLRVGDAVKAVPPYDTSFPGTLRVESIVTAPDGQIMFVVTGGWEMQRELLEAV